jgi:hypothetical protein
VADGFRRIDGANWFIGSASGLILLVVKASQRRHWTRAVELGVANDWADICVGKRVQGLRAITQLLLLSLEHA